MSTKLCSICQQPNTLFSTNLSCGHKAHKRCFSQADCASKKCFICNTHFLTRSDKKVLSVRNIKHLPKTLDKYKTYNASAVYTHTKNPTIKNMMVMSGGRLERALKEDIEMGNVEGVKFLLQSSNINFHATFNKRTLLEIAIGMGIESIIDAIKERMGIAN